MSSLPVIFFLRLLAPEKFVSCATKILKIVSDEAYPGATVADVSVIAAADMAKARDFDRPRHDKDNRKRFRRMHVVLLFL